MAPGTPAACVSAYVRDAASVGGLGALVMHRVECMAA